MDSHRKRSTPKQLRGHDGQLKQGEQEVLHARNSVGQTSGATQRCLNPGFSERNWEFETHRRRGRGFGSIERAKSGMREAHLGSRFATALGLTVTVSLVVGAALYWQAALRVYDLDGSVTAPVPTGHAPTAIYTAAARRSAQRFTAPYAFGASSVPTAPVQTSRSSDRWTKTFGLDEQAVHAIGEWRFRPALLQGRPVPTRVMFDFTFALR
jgi:hypothetical protein